MQHLFRLFQDNMFCRFCDMYFERGTLKLSSFSVYEDTPWRIFQLQ